MISLSRDHWWPLRRVMAGGFVLLALWSMFYAGAWLIGDFVQLSATNPNLQGDAQVVDFDDLAYIGQSLSQYRFYYGVALLVIAIALIALSVTLLDRTLRARPVFIAGGIALLLEAVFLSQVFSGWLFLGFLLTALAIYLATDFPNAEGSAPVSTASPSKAEQDPEIAQSSDETSAQPVPVETPIGNLAVSTEIEEALNKPPEAERTSEIDLLAREIDSDLNLDTEADYQLAQVYVEGETDPIVLASEASDDETAAQELQAVQDGAQRADDAALTIPEAQPTHATDSSVVPDQVAENTLADTPVVQPEPQSSGVEEDIIVPPQSDLFEELSALDTLEAPERAKPADSPPIHRDSRQEEDSLASLSTERRRGTPTEIGVLEEDQQVDLGFDPQRLSQQEALLPPPRRSIWGLLDWVVVSLIFACIVVIALISFI